MSDQKFRLQIARRAAQLMYARDEKEYYTAKRKAAREFGLRGRIKPSDLPSNREIRDEIQALAAFYEGDERRRRLGAMRIEALRHLRRLQVFHAHLIGSVLTGHVRAGSDIDLHVFTDTLSALTAVLDEHGLHFTVERKRVLKFGEERHFVHVHVVGDIPVELTVYPLEKVNYPFKSSITGKRIERVDVAGLEALIAHEHPEIDIEAELMRATDFLSAFDLYRSLLLPLEAVQQDPRWHPEGDALYHSLQVFELARAAIPYDEEFMTAALLHDVGKAIDPHDHVEAGLLALEGFVSDRIAFLIRHHMDAHMIEDGTLGFRAHQRLRSSEWYDDLVLLGECDRAGRVPGATVDEVEDVLAFLKGVNE